MKKALKIIAAVLVAVFLFGFWYQWKFSMGEADPIMINSSTLENKLLVATQQSEYKDELTKKVTDHFIGKEIFVSVIDVTQLEKIKRDHFDAYVIIHTNERWRPPYEVKVFLEESINKDNIFVVSTSGEGDLITEGIDGITSASELINIQADADQTINWVNNFFNQKMTKKASQEKALAIE